MTVKVWIFTGCTNQPYERTWDWWLQRNILICTGLLPLSLYYVHTHAHQCIKLPRPCASQGSLFFFIFRLPQIEVVVVLKNLTVSFFLAPFSITFTLIHCIVVMIILAIITLFHHHRHILLTTFLFISFYLYCAWPSLFLPQQVKADTAHTEPEDMEDRFFLPLLPSACSFRERWLVNHYCKTNTSLSVDLLFLSDAMR